MIPQLPKPKYDFFNSYKMIVHYNLLSTAMCYGKLKIDNSILRMGLYLQLILWGFFNSLWWLSSTSIVYVEQFSKIVHFLLMLYFQGPVEVAVVFLKDSPENKTQDVRHKNKLRLSFKDFLKKSVLWPLYYCLQGYFCPVLFLHFLTFNPFALS